MICLQDTVEFAWLVFAAAAGSVSSFDEVRPINAVLTVLTNTLRFLGQSRVDPRVALARTGSLGSTAVDADEVQVRGDNGPWALCIVSSM